MAAVTVLEGHKGWIRCVRIGLQRVVSGADDGLVKVWDARSAKCTATLEGHTKVSDSDDSM
jgi:F-box/WD-40 domain protein 7